MSLFPGSPRKAYSLPLSLSRFFVWPAPLFPPSCYLSSAASVCLLALARTCLLLRSRSRRSVGFSWARGAPRETRFSGEIAAVSRSTMEQGSFRKSQIHREWFIPFVTANVKVPSNENTYISRNTKINLCPLQFARFYFRILFYTSSAPFVTLFTDFRQSLSLPSTI